MRIATPDPFGTADLRDRVRDAWAATPARFREDANAEEELARGAYRDRVIIELAQNAADAATHAGVAGRLLLRLSGGTLLAANTGAALDAGGVEGLSTLRASAKRDHPGQRAVGRFGVGFAAVLAVTDSPSVTSRTGGVRWSREEAAAEAAGIASLAGELERRGDAVPVLRLPFPTTGEVPDGFDTVVRLPMRNEAAYALIAGLLSGIDDALLLALPGLTDVVVDIEGTVRTMSSSWADGAVTITDDGRTVTWRLVRHSGQLADALTADRPVEEPDHWSAVVAVPTDSAHRPKPLPESVPRVIHAPTPTDEQTSLPALVMATWPMDSSRRRVVPGTLTDFLAEQVAAAYAELVESLTVTGPDVLMLVPDPMPVGELDAVLHRAIIATLAEKPLVPSIADPDTLLRPDETVLIEGARSAADPAALATYVPGLPHWSWWRQDPLRRLGAREVGLDEVVDGLADVALEPEQWRDLYAALDGVDIADLMTLPVPLADGRMVRSARGVLLPTGDLASDTLTPLGLRVAHPRAVHPLLTRLGAVEATARAVLADVTVRAAVDAAASEPADQLDEVAAEKLTEAILGLVASAGTDVAEPWLAGLLLPDAGGGLTPAGELWLPGLAILDLFDVDPDDYTVADAVVRRWGRQVLRAVGVQDGFSVVRESDVPLDEHDWPDLPDADDWLSSTLDRLGDQPVPPILRELVAIRDLDLVRDDAWVDVLGRLAADADTRQALLAPAQVTVDDGTGIAVTPYLIWWLRSNAQIGGRPVGERCSSNADPLVRAVLTPAPVELDERIERALGLARTFDDLLASPDVLLDRLADPQLSLGAAELGTLYRALGAAGIAPDTVIPPDRVRVADGGRSRVAEATEVVVADGPHWLQLELPAIVPGSAGLADLLDIDLASDVHPVLLESSGTEVSVPDVVFDFLPGSPSTYVEHDDLVVNGASVGWWISGDVVHAATVDGLARGLCWLAGRWDDRLLLTEVLREPDSLPALRAEQAYE